MSMWHRHAVTRVRRCRSLVWAAARPGRADVPCRGDESSHGVGGSRLPVRRAVPCRVSRGGDAVGPMRKGARGLGKAWWIAHSPYATAERGHGSAKRTRAQPTCRHADHERDEACRSEPLCAYALRPLSARRGHLLTGESRDPVRIAFRSNRSLCCIFSCAVHLARCARISHPISFSMVWTPLSGRRRISRPDSARGPGRSGSEANLDPCSTEHFRT